MVKRMFRPALILLAFSFSSLALAQEAKQLEEKKAEAPVLKSVSCDPTCGFKVRSHDEKELTEIVTTHAKKVHKMDLTEKDVMGMMKTEKMSQKKEVKKEAEKKM